MRVLGLLLALTALFLGACATVIDRGASMGTASDPGPTVTIYVVKRGWHTDIGFAAADLPSSFADIRRELPQARYLMFGFGDRHYLLHRGGSTEGLVGAVWPGAGLVLVTGLSATPEESFGANNIVRLTLTTVQAQSLTQFVMNTLFGGGIKPLQSGPYADSFYYAAMPRYSGLHTCNTWTAEALKAADLPVHSFAVVFSGQVWRQVRAIGPSQQPITKAPLH